MNKLLHQPNRAMTLVELLSAFFLTVAALGVGFLILTAAMDTLTQVRTKQQTSAEARVALERISRDVMAAQTFSASSTAITLNPANADEHVWKVTEVDKTNSLLHGTSQQIAQEPAHRLAAADVSALSVQQSPDEITLALTLSCTPKPFKLSKTIQKWANTIP